MSYGRKVEETVVDERISIRSTNGRHKKHNSHKHHSRQTVVEVMLSFDTTGSMYSYLGAVRKNLAAALGELKEAAQREGVVLRVGVVAHGDYCDKATSYVIKFLPLLDLTPANEAKITAFIEGVGATGGGDAPECYELALNKLRKHAHWTRGSRRAVVLVGDALPHDVGYSINGYTNHIDWKEEAKRLGDMGVRVYAVQAGGRSSSRPFYDHLAAATKGARLDMSQLNTVSALVVAASMNEVGGKALTRYSERLRATGRMSAELEIVIQRISTVTTDTSGTTSRHTRTAVKVRTSGGGRVAADDDDVVAALRRLGLDASGAPALCDAAPSNKGTKGRVTDGKRVVKPCFYFNSPCGCRKQASECAFSHVKVCRFFNSRRGCSHPDTCTYAHLRVSQPPRPHGHGHGHKHAA